MPSTIERIAEEMATLDILGLECIKQLINSRIESLQASSKPKNMFQQLPRELRDRIYHHLIIIMDAYGGSYSGNWPYITIPKINQQFQAEYADMICSKFMKGEYYNRESPTIIWKKCSESTRRKVVMALAGRIYHMQDQYTSAYMSGESEVFLRLKQISALRRFPCARKRLKFWTPGTLDDTPCGYLWMSSEPDSEIASFSEHHMHNGGWELVCFDESMLVEE